MTASRVLMYLPGITPGESLPMAVEVTRTAARAVSFPTPGDAFEALHELASEERSIEETYPPSKAMKPPEEADWVRAVRETAGVPHRPNVVQSDVDVVVKTLEGIKRPKLVDIVQRLWDQLIELEKAGVAR